MRATAAERENFRENLAYLCATRASASEVCRRIGINRQQFERYLKGAAMPSPHNLRRICRHFETSEAALLGEQAKLQEVLSGKQKDAANPLINALQPQPGELALLRKYVGAYHYYFLTPSWPGEVQCGLMQFYEENGTLLSRYVGRVRDPDFRKVIRSRFVGQVTLRGDRIFVLEHARGVVDSFGQTIFYTVHQHNSNYMTGMAFGIGWHPHRGPFASQVIAKRIRETVSLREAVAACGLHAADSRALDPIVRNFFAEQKQPFVVAS